MQDTKCNKNILNYRGYILYTRFDTLFKILYKRLPYWSIVQNDKPHVRQLTENQLKLSMLSMDLKVMPKSHKGHKFILCIIDEVTNYFITVLIYHFRSEETGDALIGNVTSKFCIPDYIIMDQDSVFTLSLVNYLFKKFDLKMKTVAPHHHQSLQAEHGIKSFSTILTKHLADLGQTWPNYLPLATSAYNTFNTPN